METKVKIGHGLATVLNLGFFLAAHLASDTAWAGWFPVWLQIVSIGLVQGTAAAGAWWVKEQNPAPSTQVVSLAKLRAGGGRA